MTDVTRESVDELLRQRRNRQWLLTSALVATVLLVFGSMGAVLYLAPKIDGIVVFLIGGTLFLALAIPVLVWNYPIAGFYILFAGASLFEVTPSMGTITENVPFFVNVNVFARSHYIGGLDGLKFSPAEMLMVVTFLCWLVRT